MCRRLWVCNREVQYCYACVDSYAAAPTGYSSGSNPGRRGMSARNRFRSELSCGCGRWPMPDRIRMHVSRVQRRLVTAGSTGLLHLRFRLEGAIRSAEQRVSRVSGLDRDP